MKADSRSWMKETTRNVNRCIVTLAMYPSHRSIAKQREGRIEAGMTSGVRVYQNRSEPVLLSMNVHRSRVG